MTAKKNVCFGTGLEPEKKKHYWDLWQILNEICELEGPVVATSSPGLEDFWLLCRRVSLTLEVTH